MTVLVAQDSYAPTRKVTAAVAAGAAATILAWLAQQLGLAVPPGVEASFAVILAGGAAYLTRERAAS